MDKYLILGKQICFSVFKSSQKFKKAWQLLDTERLKQNHYDKKNMTSLNTAKMLNIFLFYKTYIKNENKKIVKYSKRLSVI